MLRMKTEHSTDVYVDQDGYFIFEQNIMGETSTVSVTPRQAEMLAEYIKEQMVAAIAKFESVEAE